MKNTILSDKQESVLDELIPIGRLAISGKVAKLPLRPRTHTLICAPSGSGKSFLLQKLGKLLGTPVLHLNVSNWQPYGSKTEHPTWDIIIDFLKNDSSGMIILDELDKINGQSEWMQYIRLEVHNLLDGKIPEEIGVRFSDTLW